MLCTTTVQNFRSFGLLTACTFHFQVCTLILFKTRHDFVYIFLIMANQNKLTSFSHVLYPFHWLIMGGFPAKIDQSLVFPSVQRFDILRSRAIRHEVDFCSLFSWSQGPLKFHKICKQRTFILSLYQLRLFGSQMGYSRRSAYSVLNQSNSIAASWNSELRLNFCLNQCCNAYQGPEWAVYLVDEKVFD